MRRQQQYISKGALIAASTVSIIDILAQWQEHRERNEKFSWSSYDGSRTLKRGMVGAAAGAAIGYSYYNYRLAQEEATPFDSDDFLLKLITSENVKSDNNLFNKISFYRDQVKASLARIFEDQLVSKPEDTGSFHKRTANKSNFDFDIILPFKRMAYSSLQEMYYDVFEKIVKEFSDKAIVTKQRKAIGLAFEDSGYDIYFDIVPGREFNNYVVDKELNLYARPEWVWQRGSSFKVNIAQQKTMTVNKPEARKVIRLLKIYRDSNSLYIPSIIIEQCTINALSEYNFGTHWSITENFLNALDFLAIKIDNNKIRDAGNSNNNLGDKIPGHLKSGIINEIRFDIETIEQNHRHLKEIFT